MAFQKIKKQILDFLGRMSKNGRISFFVSYVHNRHRLPHFNHPQNLSEIWIKRVLDGKINKIAYLADKYAVRKYVEDKGLGNILTPLVAVFDSSDEIDFDTFPSKFALKANFGAGYNIICTDKNKFNQETAKKQMAEWLKPQHYSESERHYNLIPQKIVCEEFIDDGTGGFPIDYKFMCIKGEVVCILACSGREKGHADYLPYSLDWQPLYDFYKNNPADIKLVAKPSNLDEMVGVAKQLAKGIDLVRIDLYSNGNRIWFGEITLTPAGCIFHRWSQKALDVLGKYYRSH